jgi:hypothetical protein
MNKSKPLVELSALLESGESTLTSIFAALIDLSGVENLVESDFPLLKSELSEKLVAYLNDASGRSAMLPELDTFLRFSDELSAAAREELLNQNRCLALLMVDLLGLALDREKRRFHELDDHFLIAITIAKVFDLSKRQRACGLVKAAIGSIESKVDGFAGPMHN